jgi:hypothetical protein
MLPEHYGTWNALGRTPLASPQPMLGAFIFLRHYRIWSLAARFFAWLRWYFIEHSNCPSDLLLRFVWQLTTPRHPARKLLLSSLSRWFVEIPDAQLATSRFLVTKFCTMYASDPSKYCPWPVDGRAGSWLSDLHALIVQALPEGRHALDKTLQELTQGGDSLGQKRSLVMYLLRTRDALRKICERDGGLWPAVLKAPAAVKKSFKAHLEAVCQDVLATKEYSGKHLLELSAITATELETFPGDPEFEDVEDPDRTAKILESSTEDISAAANDRELPEEIPVSAGKEGSAHANGGKRKRSINEDRPADSGNRGKPTTPSGSGGPKSPRKESSSLTSSNAHQISAQTTKPAINASNKQSASHLSSSSTPAATSSTAPTPKPAASMLPATPAQAGSTASTSTSTSKKPQPRPSYKRKPQDERQRLAAQHLNIQSPSPF